MVLRNFHDEKVFFLHVAIVLTCFYPKNHKINFFRAFRVRSCLLLLKLQFLPFTLVLQIPNLRLFLIQYGLRSPFVSQITLLTEGFPRFLYAMLGDA